MPIKIAIVIESSSLVKIEESDRTLSSNSPPNYHGLDHGQMKRAGAVSPAKIELSMSFAVSVCPVTLRSVVSCVVRGCYVMYTVQSYSRNYSTVVFANVHVVAICVAFADSLRSAINSDFISFSFTFAHSFFLVGC